MKLHSIIPPITIADYVSKIFAIEDCKLDIETGLPLIANGYPGFVFQTANSEPTLCEGNKVNSLFLFGQTIKPVKLFTTGKLTLIAYFFYPHTLKTLFGVNAKELTDISIDLNYLQSAKKINLKDKLINAPALSMRLQLMNNYVLKLIESSYLKIPNDIHFATQSLRKSKGLLPISNVQKDLNFSERTFRRLFDLHVGISPKAFSRICQFDSAFQQLNTNQFSKLSDVAYENGYSDQSHLLRTFREFTTFSPSEYLKKTSDFLLLNR